MVGKEHGEMTHSPAVILLPADWGEHSSVTRDFKGETKLRERCVERDHCN